MRGFFYDPCNYKELSLVREVPHLCTSTERKKKENLQHGKSYVTSSSEKIKRLIQPKTKAKKYEHSETTGNGTNPM